MKWAKCPENCNACLHSIECDNEGLYRSTWPDWLIATVILGIGAFVFAVTLAIVGLVLRRWG